MTYETMTWAAADGVATITLNRPQALNAMTPAFWREMPLIFQEIDARADVRVVVIRSTGKHFTAGLDLKTAAGELMSDPKLDPGRARERLRRKIRAMQETFSVIDRCRVPVIAAVQGGCLGAGVDLITACCLRYATRDAFFTIQEINIAIVADVGTLQRAPYLLPQGILRELAYSGRRMAAEEAARYGFVNGIAEDHESCLAMAEAMARDIAAKSPLAITGIKQVLNQGRGRPVEDGLDYVATWNAAMLLGEDVQKAALAALAKNQADFADLAP
ncbi:MAG: crotonase/enoyl-CoA hydratase family protein [Pseudomonadota bacterium]